MTTTCGQGITSECLLRCGRGGGILNARTRPGTLIRLAGLRDSRPVPGTTGWLGKLAAVTEAVEQNESALVWSPNFSTGVAVFSGIRRWRRPSCFGMKRNMVHGPGKSIMINKKDAPSGTLLHLVEAMREAGFSREINVGSNRAGPSPGNA